MEISVNGRTIGEREIARETQYHPSSSLDEARHRAAQALVVRELLLQRAEALGIANPGDDLDEERVRALVEREVSVPVADEPACRRYYESNKAKFRSPDLIEARHILFSAAPDDRQAVAAARARAQGAIEVLTAEPHRFAELAQELSACPSAKQGGNLGQLSRGGTVPEIETFLFELEEGQLCPVPVPSRYGFHVLRVERRVDGQPLPFAAVHEKIAAYLGERVWRQAIRQYIELLVGGASVTGIDLRGASSPLVQ
jgi:peptidyl-prolyl cis-trans isomerase C